jgi:hypothetical protein
VPRGPTVRERERERDRDSQRGRKEDERRKMKKKERKERDKDETFLSFSLSPFLSSLLSSSQNLYYYCYNDTCTEEAYWDLHGRSIHPNFDQILQWDSDMVLYCIASKKRKRKENQRRRGREPEDRKGKEITRRERRGNETQTKETERVKETNTEEILIGLFFLFLRT